MTRYSKLIAAAMTGLTVAVAQGLVVGRTAAAVAVLGAVLVSLGVYAAPKNTP